MVVAALCAMRFSWNEEDKAMIHVIRKIERLPKELMDSFREIGTATVHEASGKKGAVDYGIKPIARGVRICGPAR